MWSVSASVDKKNPTHRVGRSIPDVGAGGGRRYGATRRMEHAVFRTFVLSGNRENCAQNDLNAGACGHGPKDRRRPKRPMFFRSVRRKRSSSPGNKGPGMGDLRVAMPLCLHRV